MSENKKYKAIILIGGKSKGTRFRPLSLDLPKPFFPVAGQPIISQHIRSLVQLGNVSEVLLLGFYEESFLKAFVARISREYEIPITYLREPESLGTAGGLYYFRNRIMQGNPERIILMHGDICSNFPMKQICEFHESHLKDVTIVGTTVSEEKAHRFGCIVFNEQENALGGLVVHYAEKPETFISNLINCGIYLINSSLIEKLPEIKNSTQTYTKIFASAFSSLNISLEREVFPYLAGTGDLYVYKLQPSDFWRQIKNPRDAIECSLICMHYFLQQYPELLARQSDFSCQLIGEVIIDPSAEIDPTAKIGPNVTIGKSVVIGPGVRISNSIILDGVTIQDNSFVNYSILGWNSSIGKWCRIEGSPADSTEQVHNNKDKITILGSGVKVDHELIVRNTIVLHHRELNDSTSDRILL
jgi:mannose-1-phosphate guanylyltransferase